MKLLKYNSSKDSWVNTYSTILDKIPMTVFYLWPYGLEGMGLILDNIVINDTYNDPANINHFNMNGYPKSFNFKYKDQNYKMVLDTHMLDCWPTREEFELFCLENGVDSTDVPFLTQEEICAQMLEVIETMNTKDIVDSLRI